MRWWNGRPACAISRIRAAGEAFRSAGWTRLKQRYGLDGFKFDGGDVHFVAHDARQRRPITALDYPDLYNREATAHYGWNETRVGIYSQPLGMVQRLMDKHSVWGSENGIGAIRAGGA